MEVHAHSHTEGKKFTHYLWEFLMLFLAVFCGFLAENFREHQVDHSRERQYMASILEDLRSDTTLLTLVSKYWNSINIRIDSVAEAIQFPLSNTNLFKVYSQINKALDYNSFINNDRTVSQLKNAGGFRLIRKQVVANKIITYDQFNRDAMANIAFQHNKFYENVTALRNKVFVEEIINKIFYRYEFAPVPDSARSWVFDMIKMNRSPYSEQTQAELLFEFKNALMAYRKDFSNMLYGYDRLLVFQHELIKLIKQEYHFE